MPVLQYTPTGESDAVSIDLLEKESVLDALLRSGFDAPYGCRAGVCQSCIMQGDAANIPATSQQGLKPTQVEQGYFLSCCCTPQNNLACSHDSEELLTSTAKVTAIEPLNKQVFRLTLATELSFRAGQFMNLWRDKTIARSYSIASVSSSLESSTVESTDSEQKNLLEFHIKRIENGAFSDWAFSNLKPSDDIELQGPLGECFYTLTDKSQPIFLSGIGTGLAPLVGILKDALNQGHTGKISLLLGAKSSDNFYLMDELLELVKKHVNLAVIFVSQTCQDGYIKPPLIQVEGDIYQTLKARLPSLKGYAVYLCGAESFVKKMKKQCFLQDAKLNEIFSDAFIAS